MAVHVAPLLRVRDGLIDAQAEPPQRWWLAHEVAELEPHLIARREEHPRGHAGASVFECEIRAAVAIGDEGDALPVPIISGAGRGIQPDYRVAPIRDDDPDAFSTGGVVDPYASALA